VRGASSSIVLVDIDRIAVHQFERRQIGAIQQRPERLKRETLFVRWIQVEVSVWNVNAGHQGQCLKELAVVGQGYEQRLDFLRRLEELRIEVWTRRYEYRFV
jgi:hypothetical protein